MLCHLQEGTLEAFGERQVPELIARLEAADLVVGFNVRRFDYRVLSGYTGVDYLRKLPTLDLLDDVRQSLGFRLALNHLALETLGREKTADGLQSLEWVRQGRLDLVEAYCFKDVEILRDLYLFGRRMGYILYRDKQDHRLKHVICNDGAHPAIKAVDKIEILFRSHGFCEGSVTPYISKHYRY